MPCPFCSSTAAQKRPDGRCVSCGKLLPEELRGSPDPVPQTPVQSSLMKAGDSIEWYDPLQPGDIVILLQVHQGRFGLKRVTPKEAARIPGPKYIVPAAWGSLGLFFTVDGWEEYHPPAARKPWWRFW
jgi:hypothetical protein